MQVVEENVYMQWWYKIQTTWSTTTTTTTTTALLLAVVLLGGTAESISSSAYSDQMYLHMVRLSVCMSSVTIEHLGRNKMPLGRDTCVVPDNIVIVCWW